MLLHNFLNTFWPVDPGICATLLGGAAFVITVFPEKLIKTSLRRSIATFLCIAFVVAEIYAIKHDRAVSSDQHAQEMRDIFARFVGLHQDVVDLQSNFQATQQAHVLPSDNLKRRALDLSNEMLQFLVSREVPPGYGQGGFGEGPYGGKAADKSYDDETLQTYFNAFQSRVTDIREEFKRRGMTDKRLDSEYANPTNTYSIRAIAERIGMLAKRLPN